MPSKYALMYTIGLHFRIAKLHLDGLESYITKIYIFSLGLKLDENSPESMGTYQY